MRARSTATAARAASDATPRRGRPPRLSREAILDAALALLDRAPREPLTVARIAAEVDAVPAALYRHFASLDELLENKSLLDETVREQIQRRTAGLGIEVESVGVKDIILPGEMKTLLAKVVEAEKAAQANLIRRREETAATRSLLNTAKVMEDNPVALRLKELETLEKITEKIDKISVFGGLEGVLKDLVKIQV